jgi:hypothetical protein
MSFQRPVPTSPRVSKLPCEGERQRFRDCAGFCAASCLIPEYRATQTHSFSDRAVARLCRFLCVRCALSVLSFPFFLRIGYSEKCH